MDELMSMMYQLADGETAQVVQSIQETMQVSIVPAVVAAVLGLAKHLGFVLLHQFYSYITLQNSVTNWFRHIMCSN